MSVFHAVRGTSIPLAASLLAADLPAPAPALLALPPLQSHTVGPCSLAQVVMTEALKAWGDDGLDAHLRMVQREYATRAEVVAAACQKVCGATLLHERGS